MRKNDKKSEMNNSGLIAEIEKRFERHTNILMEQVHHEVKTVAEGHGILAKKIDKVDTGQEMIAKRLDKVESDIGNVKSELHTIKIAVIDTSHRVDKIDKKLSENLNNYEKRIAKLEEKVLV